MSIDAAIVDYSAALLLRYFRGGAAQESGGPRLDHLRDLAILKGHWSLSEPVRALVSHLLTHPHEAQSLLRSRERIDDAVARGRIDARRTWLYRQQSGLPSAMVSHEPVRSFLSGPNVLLAWVLREAAAYSSRLLAWQGTSSAYLPFLEAMQSDLRQVQRFEALREPLRALSLGQRPDAGAVRNAARARRPVYRLAVDAYRVFQGLERGDREAMERVARSALIGPLEDWRRFELCVGLAIGEALGRLTGEPVNLHLLASDSKAPIVAAGRFAVFWQQVTPYHSPAPLEPSEAISRAAIADYGVGVGTERPDLIVVDRDKDAVVSIIEVKYIAGDTATARFREAVEQVVRYGRSYSQVQDRDALLSRSLVALSRNAPMRQSNAAPAPFAVDFATVMQPDGLAGWAASLVA